MHELPVLSTSEASGGCCGGGSELLTLEWHQIDRKACIIRLEPGTTKNREGRVFAYGVLDEVKAAIEGLWARHEAIEKRGIIAPLVFCRLKGQAVKTFWKRWKTAAAAAGCPGRIPHDFRRTRQEPRQCLPWGWRDG